MINQPACSRCESDIIYSYMLGGGGQIKVIHLLPTLVIAESLFLIDLHIRLSVFFRCCQHLWKCTLLTGSPPVVLYYNNLINTAGLNASDYMAQRCYSENTSREEQTGCERQTKKKNRKRGREGRWNYNKVRRGRWRDRLKWKAQCEWMWLWIERNYR